MGKIPKQIDVRQIHFFASTLLMGSVLLSNFFVGFLWLRQRRLIGAGLAYRSIAEKEELPTAAARVMNPEPTLAPR